MDEMVACNSSFIDSKEEFTRSLAFYCQYFGISFPSKPKNKVSNRNVTGYLKLVFISDLYNTLTDLPDLKSKRKDDDSTTLLEPFEQYRFPSIS